MTQLQLLTELPLAWPLLAMVAATALAWWLSHRETRDLAGPLNWLLPSLRAGAVALILAMLLEPAVQQRVFLGEPSRLQVWIDGSASMRETDSDDTRRASRYQRTIDLVAGGDIPRLETWAGQGEVEVRRFVGETAELLWRSVPTAALPPVPSTEAWLPAAWGQATSLELPLRQSTTARQVSEETGDVRTPHLLLSDGRHNEGPSPLDQLNDWPSEGSPVWVVGMGSAEPPPRMTIAGATMPGDLFRTDRLQAVIELVDHRPAGEPWLLTVRLDLPQPSPAEPGLAQPAGPLLWSQQVVSDGSGIRECVVSFPLEPVVASLVTRNAPTTDTLAVPLLVEVEPARAIPAAWPGRTLRRLVGVTTRRQRVLLLDGRSRWETRYLRNALERDPRWEVDAFLLKPRQPPEWFAQQADPRAFPATAEDWLTYDLVITGEVEASAEGVAAMRLLREAVERGGTGWVVIDGQRNTWGRAAFAKLREMLPVQRLPARTAAVGVASGWAAEVTDQAADLGALQLGDASLEANRAAWDRLPELRNLVPVQLLPGGERLVDAVRAAAREPLITTRLYGGGRVVHLASDETWRWRFEVADEVHQRFWNQLARYAMRMPFAVRNDYAALDTGDVMVAAGQPVPVRALLKDSSGHLSDTTLVRVVALREGRPVESLSLAADPALPGLFRGQWTSLAPGTYTVRLEATGFPAEALAFETAVQVVAPPSPEQREITRNDALLRQIAEQTGGHYVPEEQVEEMWERIALESTGRVVETETELWQSGWWLAVAMGLLGAEWWLRKKAGLI